LLYAGEHFDTNSQDYYLRARWYDSLSGRFNRMDPFAGNNQDPQSLHKYLYCHANPINGIDPSGLMFTLTGKIVTLAITTVLTGLLGGTISKMSGGSFVYGAIYGSLIGFVIMRTILFQFHKLPKVLAAGLTGGILNALGERLGHYQKKVTGLASEPWDDLRYVDPFIRGFTWSAAAEAFGSGIKSEVMIAISTSILADVVKLISDIFSTGWPDINQWKQIAVDTVFNALIAAATTAYMNAYVDLDALAKLDAEWVKSWITGIFAIPVNSMLNVLKGVVKEEI